MIRCSHRVGLSLALLCAWALTQPVRAQLPKGEEILDKYVTATGGKELHAKFKNRVMKGSIEVPAANIKGDMVTYHASPNSMLVEVELGGFGKIQEGCDGKVAWSVGPTGPRVKEGEEKAAALRRADFLDDVNWRSQYKKAECKGEETVEGKNCYKVELTNPEDRVRTNYYDRSTNLLVKTVGTEITGQGNVETEAVPSEYKKFDGLLIPCKVRQTAAGQEIIITIAKVEHDAKLPANCFALPDEIKKLVQKEKKD